VPSGRRMRVEEGDVGLVRGVNGEELDIILSKSTRRRVGEGAPGRAAANKGACARGAGKGVGGPRTVAAASCLLSPRKATQRRTAYVGGSLVAFGGGCWQRPYLRETCMGRYGEIAAVPEAAISAGGATETMCVESGGGGGGERRGTAKQSSRAGARAQQSSHGTRRQWAISPAGARGPPPPTPPSPPGYRAPDEDRSNQRRELDRRDVGAIGQSDGLQDLP